MTALTVTPLHVTTSAANGTERTKRRLLDVLKRCGPQTAQDLAAQLEVTVPAARRHLGDLLDHGLIETRVEKPGGRGRPQHVYRLTERGEAAFPKTYAALCVDVLRHLQDLYGQDAVLKVFEARNEQVAGPLKDELDALDSLPARLALLTARLTEQGFDAVLDETLEGGEVVWTITQRNCPSLTVARQFPELCMAELTFMAHLTGLPVTRDARIVTGQPYCRYRVAAGAPADSGTGVPCPCHAARPDQGAE